MDISKMAPNVTFITKKWNLVANWTIRIHFFLLINVTFQAILEMFILSLWRVAEMVTCKKPAPETLTDKGRMQKSQTLDLRNNSKRYVYHCKGGIWLSIGPSEITFY